jgi:hypothetical protein
MVYDNAGNLKVNVKAGSAGGTEYTEDAAAPANPVGGVQQLVRLDTPATLTSTDGDIVSRRGTNYGAAYSQIVDSSGNYVDTFGGGTQYTEDDAAAANPVGNAQILVRQDTPATLTTTDGDNVARRSTDYGAAYTQIVTSTGSFVDSFGGSGGTSATDDAAFTIGGASNTTVMAGLADETTPDSVDEGDSGAVRMTLDRKLLTRVVGATDANRMDVDASGHAQVDIAASSATVTTTPAVVGGGTEATAQRVTIANDSTGVLSVDDGGANLSVDWAGTVPPIGAGTEAAALRVTMATDSTGVVSVDDNGAGLTVDAANDGSLTAQVGDGTDVLNVLVEDAPAAGGETGIQTLGIRRDADTSPVSLDGDFHPMVFDSTGKLKVEVFDGGDSHTVDGTVTVTHPALGGGVEAGAQRVTIANDSTGVLSVDDGGGDLSVDWAGTAPPIGAGTEAAALRVTMATDSTGVVSVDDNGANLSVDWGGTVPPIGAGTEAAALRVTLATDSTGLVSVDDNGSSLTIDQATASNLNAQVVGTAASDAPVSGNPVAVAARASNVEPTAVSTDGDVVMPWADRFGRLVFVGHHPPDTATAGAHGPYNENVTASGDTELIAAPSAGQSIYVTQLYMSNGGTAKIDAAVREGAAGTIRWRGALAADGGGVQTEFNPPMVLPAATALTANLCAAGDVDFNVQFFVAAVPA